MNFATRFQVPLGEFMLDHGGLTDPTKHPHEVFVLYSIPSFDNAKPEYVAGKDIGSSKKNVEEGDILLSRIVPHIRRCWIVAKHSEGKTLASSEWIVFRSKKIHAPYLRHFLVSDAFHQQFMQTVAGVGGSLLRANPRYVANILIPLPPLDEQRRIAAILDKADTLRRKRKRALDLLSALNRSVFSWTFGSREAWIRGKNHASLFDICSPKQWRTISSEQLLKEGYPVYGANGKIGYFNEFNHEHETVLISCRGATCGTINICEPQSYVTGNAMALDDVTNDVNIKYLADALRVRGVKDAITGTAQPQITRQSLGVVTIPIPERKAQDKYVNRVNRLERHIRIAKTSIQKMDILSSSLQHRAFTGQL